MRLHEWRRLYFEDATGTLQTIRGVPAGYLEEFRSLLKLIRQQVEKGNPDTTFAGLYCENGILRQAVDRALQLNGVEAKNLTLPMIQEFFFAYERDGEIRPGLLDELNLPPDTGIKGTATLEEFIAGLAVSLVSVGLEPSLSSAIDLLRRTPPDELQAYIDERIRQLDPKAGTSKSKASEEFAKSLEELPPEQDPTLDFTGFTGPK